ncbi:putative phosphoribosyltransferase [Hyella patelloides LEGE 07179]|uniref:Putative phosphoribosyltransferase n=1 Tax=Hyella patelloides LEGE 07179 TaxID=945734 RepID=A0A563VS99_9CYAN|nr:phosphoribosyltransferase [Hyella patelloides]VEP14281.1 putative phosphoribosyltransferase [Hyella patelloides LEGE 07179]
MSDLYISWTEYHQKIEALAIKIYQSGWKCDRIVCLAKGGLRVGDILCRIFDVPLAVLSTASYGGENNQTRGKITVSQNISMTEKTLSGRVLLADDLVDSGISLQVAQKWLQERYRGEITELKTAVIWCKSCSVCEPDYYVDYLADNPWIHQPFEIYENIAIESLIR